MTQMRRYALDRAIDFLGSWLALRARQVSLPGFAVAVSHRGRVVFDRAYGLADIEKGEPLTTNHQFSVGSQAKMLTATAIMQLVEQGKLGLDDKVVTHVPWLASHRDVRYRTITIRQLLCHASGMVRDGLDSDCWQFLKPFPDKAELQEMILAVNLAFEPGSHLKYSNPGYCLLGEIIERRGRMPYADYVAEHILKPLGLGLTTLPGPQVPVPKGYSLAMDQARRPIDMPIPINALTPVAGWYATASDMCRFVHAHMKSNTGLLADKTKKAMHTSPTWSDEATMGFNVQYGLGFTIQKIDGRTLVGHSGGFWGHKSCTYFDPDQELAVAVLVNAQDAVAMQILRGVFHVFDFFHQNVTGPLPEHLKKLDIGLKGEYATLQLVPTNRQIAVVRHIDWLPFADPEELEYLNKSTLRLKRAHPYLSAGELVKLTLDKGRIAQARFTGWTMQAVKI